MANNAKRDTKSDILWNLFADELIDRMKNGEEVVGADGSIQTKKVGSPTLAVIAKFLKDNDVGGGGEEDPASKLDTLLKQAQKDLDGDRLPFS